MIALRPHLPGERAVCQRIHSLASGFDLDNLPRLLFRREQKPGIKLLPVRVSESKSAPVVVEHRVTDFSQPQPGTIHIELRQAQVRIEGSADPALVRVLLECLRG